MSFLYKVETAGHEEFEITREDIEGLDVHRLAPDLFHVLDGNRGVNAKVLEADYDAKRFTLLMDGRKVEIQLRDPVEIQVREMGLDVLETAHAKEIVAPMPGLVLSIDVAEGDTVAAGDTLVILEAMKMENVLSSPGDGVVSEIKVQSGQAVEKSQVLIVFE